MSDLKRYDYCIEDRSDGYETWEVHGVFERKNGAYIKYKDILKIKADAVREYANSYYQSKLVRGYTKAMQYADKIERGEV